MGCCSKELIVQGCCCQNIALEFPPKLGVAQECSTCCLKCKCCMEFPCFPCLPCGCCGPTCGWNPTLCKVKGTCFCFAVQGSFPCGPETPILFTPLPFCLVYPKTGCCLTLDGAGAKKAEEQDAPKFDTVEGGAGGPP